jgi:hypothetical protein
MASHDSIPQGAMKVHVVIPSPVLDERVDLDK